jgi:DNA excision repair protein ERCC-8
MLKKRTRQESNVYTPMSMSSYILHHSLQSNQSHCTWRRILSPHVRNITALTLDSLNSRFLLSAAMDGKCCIFDTRQLQTLQYPQSLNEDANPEDVDLSPAVDAQIKSKITSAKWYPFDSGLFFTTTVDGPLLQVWDANRFAPVLSYDSKTEDESAAYQAAVSWESVVAVACGSGVIQIFDIRAGSACQEHVGHANQVWSVEFSGLSSFILASGSKDRTIRLWDIRRAGEIMILDQFNEAFPLVNQSFADRQQSFHRSSSISSHSGAVVQVHFLQDGIHLLSSGTDNKLRLWDTFSGENMQVNYVTQIEDPASGRSTQVPSKCVLYNRFEVFNMGRLIFNPCGGAVKVFDSYTGRVLQNLHLRGAVAPISTCVVEESTWEHLLSRFDTRFKRRNHEFVR